MLIVEDLHKSFATAQGTLPVLRGVDLRLGAGESLALMGESGSGKSTLLHVIAGLETPDAGHVLVDGAPLHARGETGLARWRRSGIGLVFQQYNLIGSLDVSANLAFQARLAGRHDAAWLAHLTERLGLPALLSRYPEQLSGGQQQRVAIGRALAGRPPLVLADEPTGSLDEASSDAVLDLLLELVRDAGSALLMVTHSARLAERLSRRLVLHLGRVSMDEGHTAGPADASAVAHADGAAAAAAR
ncbi:ABC transporter ATP-binding protein [Bordetella bronchialis]|uniref:ABC transporter ATP-binding protein n=1 Tax=Bordetella bronchialis TaxID=463025 RepID=UPI0009F67757|nr:ABC transporter ATP-binding protein [Bordetella bronchialis]